MNNYTIIILVIAVPILASLAGALVVIHSRNPRFDEPLSLSVVTQFIRAGALTTRKALLFLVACIPLTYISSFFPFPFLPILVTSFCALFVLRVSRSYDTTPDPNLEVLEALQRTTHTVSDAVVHLQLLHTRIGTKQREIEEKERRSAALQLEIGAHVKRSEAWRNLTSEQQALLIDTVTSSQRRSALLNVAVALGSISINLIATLIWTLMGNPGKEKIIASVSELFHLR